MVTETPTPRPLKGATWRLAIVATLPLLAAFAVAVWLLVSWALGGQPFWYTPVVNLSEAAATHDTGEAYRLIAYEKQDPNRKWPIRAGLLANREVLLTPLEAAVEARRLQMVRLLVYYGARVEASQRATLICTAEARADRETVDFLITTGDGSDPRPCPEVASTP